MIRKEKKSESTDNATPEERSQSSFRALTLGCIGVVYGDIGTSPLYAFRETAHHVAHDGTILRPEVYGILSLIIWILILNVTLKYVLFLLRIDNHGEGGNLSLVALARKAVPRWSNALLLMGVLGAALFFGEAAITPAISVLSAVEGLKLVTPAFESWVLPLSILIMVVLFAVQKGGTEKVSRFFGPITLIWFLTLAALGLSWIIREPSVLASFNPYYAVAFLVSHPGIALFVMGSSFLAVTGVEALYIDLGHFGRKPIQTAWLSLVFPCLVLNYLGQGALILQDPQAIANSFFLMAPGWGLIPLILLATTATIIASQAVITGAFSLTQQAIQFGLLPRMEVRHTSLHEKGQIYMPLVNRTLLWTVLLLIVIFKSSSGLAAAYGISVNGTMIVTSLLAFIVTWKVLKKKPAFAALLVLPFLIIESGFLWANLQKFLDGGFVPVFMSGLVILLMLTWLKGTRYLYRQARHSAVSITDLVEMLDRKPPLTIEGTAIFLTSDPQSAPVALMQNLRHNKVLHQQNIILTVVTTHYPKVPDHERFIIEPISSSFKRMIVSFGYMETPNLPRALLIAHNYGLDIDIHEVSYFLGRRTIISSSAHRSRADLAQSWRRNVAERQGSSLAQLKQAYKIANMGGLPEWQDHIYISLARSAISATEFYCIPRHQVVELGMQMAV